MACGPVPARGSRVVTEAVGPRRARALLERVIGLADEPADDDDLRLRKRVLVIASYILIVGALQLLRWPVRALLTVAEVTTSIRTIAVEVDFEHEDAGVDRPSVINCDGAHTITKTSSTTYTGFRERRDD